MGSWGTSISANDTYLDIYQEFFALYNKGMEPDAISQKLILDYQAIIAENDSSDLNNFWFALAMAQWETRSLESGTFAKVRSIINFGNDLLHWHPEDRTRRQKVLTAFFFK